MALCDGGVERAKLAEGDLLVKAGGDPPLKPAQCIIRKY
jgi:hypothetical protein